MTTLFRSATHSVHVIGIPGRGSTIFSRMRSGAFLAFISTAAFALAACGGSPSPDAGDSGPGSDGQNHSDGSDTHPDMTTDGSSSSGGMFEVGGVLSGLDSEKTVVLRNNGADDLVLTANGPFVFASLLAQSATYSVTVATQPVGQVCTVALGDGAVGTTDVATVVVTCADLPTHTVGGTLSGLVSGNTLVLSNNGGNNLTITTNGSFTFSTPVAEGLQYSVAVAIPPLGQSCTVSSGAGTVGTSNVNSVTVSCVQNHYTVAVPFLGSATAGVLCWGTAAIGSP